MAKRRVTPTAAGPVPPRVALVDANVFFAPRMRDLVMYLHGAEVINVQWTREIEAEWTRNVVAKHGADIDGIQDCLRGMRNAVDGWEVTGYEKHIDQFEAVDAKDRHVAAAAYKLSLDEWPGQPVALVTKNVEDFPQEAFNDTQVTRYPLGAYIDALYAAEPDAVAAVAQTCRKKLTNRPLNREQYVAVLVGHGCTATASGLAITWGVECPKVTSGGTLYYESDMPKRTATGKKTKK